LYHSFSVKYHTFRFCQGFFRKNPFFGETLTKKTRITAGIRGGDCTAAVKIPVIGMGGINAWLDRKGIASVKEIIGAVKI